MNVSKKVEHVDVSLGKGNLLSYKVSSINYNSIEVSYDLVKVEQDVILSCNHYDF